MYAVVVSGGKQYRVKVGQSLKLEKIELEPGAELEFDKVLFVGEGDDIKCGAPNVNACKVTARIESHGRHKKIKILKMKRRKHHMKRMGHRQWFTEVKITHIEAA